MSLANKVASAARSAVDNARKTAGQALHDREALRKRIGGGVRELPMTAVQYTVKGVGQALLIGDRVRQEIGRRVGRGDDGTEPTAERHQTAAPATPAKSAFEEAAERPQAVRPARKARAAKGGIDGVEAVPAAEKPAAVADEPASPVEESPAEQPAPEASLPAAAAETGAPAESPAPEAELPIAEYDERTVPSLRARMKGLTVADLRTLIEYEQTHAARADVIAMFERRIAKLESGE